jgi:hypothetical protein
MDGLYFIFWACMIFAIFQSKQISIKQKKVFGIALALIVITTAIALMVL